MLELSVTDPDVSMPLRLLRWVDARFPSARQLWNDHWGRYYAPKNFNTWYFFGSLALLVLVIQIVTGIFLTMHYKPDAATAFASVEYIMREVPGGWIIRYMHSTGASANAGSLASLARSTKAQCGRAGTALPPQSDRRLG